MKRYMLTLTLALLLGGCGPSILGGGGCDFCVSEHPPSDLGAILDAVLNPREPDRPDVTLPPDPTRSPVGDSRLTLDGYTHGAPSVDGR